MVLQPRGQGVISMLLKQALGAHTATTPSFRFSLVLPV